MLRACWRTVKEKNLRANPNPTHKTIANKRTVLGAPPPPTAAAADAAEPSFEKIKDRGRRRKVKKKCKNAYIY